MKKQFVIFMFIISWGAALYAQDKPGSPYRNLYRAYRQGNYEEAMKGAEAALAERPDDLKLHYLQAKICLALQAWDRAIAESQHILGKDGNFGKAHVVLGRAYLGKENYKEALKHFETAVKEGIEFPNVYHDMAVLYAYGRDYESAIREAKKAVAKKPDFFEGLYALGRFYTETERYQEAIPYFERALDLDPDHVKAMEFLALSYLEAGNKAKARDLALEVLEEDPESAMAVFVLKESPKRK